MITLSNITKSFNRSNVVNNLSLEIAKGEIFGLLGPNAAGKTTTIRILCGLLKPSSGEASIGGIALSDNSDALKHKIGYVAQYFGLYDELSVMENLRFYASLYERTDEKTLLGLLKRYKIFEYKDAKAGSLSGGYKRRLSLCCALCHQPEVLFLDEPTAGIDPSTRKELWDIFYELSQEGKTLFVTTHYMEEAQRCNKIAFLNKGVVVAEGSPTEVENSLEAYDVYKLTQEFKYELLEVLRTDDLVYLVNQFGDELRIIVKKECSKEWLGGLIAPYTQGDVSLESTRANLEDVFIALTQEVVA